ncbi:hypothetical protein ACOSQ2_022410 [Xanthoceras sorbifolium]
MCHVNSFEVKVLAAYSSKVLAISLSCNFLEIMSFIGEAFLTAAIQGLFSKLNSPELLQLLNQDDQIHADLQKLQTTLTMVHAVLDDAEEKQIRNRLVRAWIDELKSLAYDVDDILDEFATEALRRKLLPETQAGSNHKIWKVIPTCCTRFSPQTIKFNVMMRSKIQKINARLQFIVEQKNGLDLKENSAGGSSKVRERQPSSSVVDKTRVYGRDGDKEAIIELLLKNKGANGGVSVIPIIGMGGLGKTTLAQLVYNDDRVQGHFDLKAWVCVSQDFDVKRVTKTILLSVAAGTAVVTGDDDLNMLQVKLKQALSMKRFLLVLDDLWNENYDKWTTLRCPFEDGLPESKIIITTRNQSVSSIVGTLPTYPLKVLSYDACLCVFTQHSLGTNDFTAHQHLKEIGEKIVKRCNGLPLAAKTLGGLLRGKINHNSWEDVLSCKIWDIPEERSGIIPALRLSYYYLPSHLKRCFAYLSILPKDFKFSKDKIILLWMAEGFLQHENGNKQMEDLGTEYFEDLQSRSFIQHSGRDVSQFEMHDLINDLAQWAAGEICFNMENMQEVDKQGKITKKSRHFSYIRDKHDGITKFEVVYDVNNLQNFHYNGGLHDGFNTFNAFDEVKHLRTFLPLESQESSGDDYYLTADVLGILPKLCRLRVLSLHECSIVELPDATGGLRHLRYLDLSFTKIVYLPESISTLYNLQTLNVDACWCLRKLCSDMGNLVNLRHLKNSGTVSLVEMPQRMDKLSNLRTLSRFVVGKSIGSGLGKLKSLPHLQRSLELSKLENLTNAKDAREADLISKRSITQLLLEWTGSRTDDSQKIKLQMDVLDMLRPHQSLKKLTIRGYGGTRFPTWIGNFSFSNLVDLSFDNCQNCTLLPSVGQLPLLKKLGISRMATIKSVGPEFCGDGLSTPFPSLETLCFADLQEWEFWMPHGSSQNIDGFPLLQELSIFGCSKLQKSLPEHLPSLRSLVIEGCEQLSVSVQNLPTSCRLQIEGCKEVVCSAHLLKPEVVYDAFSNICLKESWIQGSQNVEVRTLSYEKPTSLSFNTQMGSQHDFSFLQCWLKKEEVLQQERRLCNFQHVHLWECDCIVKLPLVLQSLNFLRGITIENCPTVVSLPEVDLPSQLRSIEIRKCNALESLPETWMHINGTSLVRLVVEHCDSLTHIARCQLPSSLASLSIGHCDSLQYIAGGQLPSSLEYLSIKHCGSLKEISGDQLPLSLERLSIYKCNSLTYIARGQLPLNLKQLEIVYCNILQSLLDEENINNGSSENTSLLEDLVISYCRSLTSLFFETELPASLKHIELRDCLNLASLTSNGNLPKALKWLHIVNCSKLEVIAERFPDDTSLESIEIIDCRNLKFLPDDLHKCSHLQKIYVSLCPSLASFPERGLPSTKLTDLYIYGCRKLEALPNQMHNLTSLEKLTIGMCAVPFPQDGFPTNLRSLTIEHVKICKPVFKWGLHRFTSLTSLQIDGGCTDMVSFPEMMLPTSLTDLWICGFPKLERLSFFAQNHTSLLILALCRCPNLKYFPKKGLPLSLLTLYIINCPWLQQRCEKNEGQYWPLIAHIPSINIRN